MKTTAKITMVFLVSLALCAAAHADELLVPAEYLTIQAAIDAAFDGDTVIVADGTYTGPGNRDIDFLGKAITVRSESGPNNCIIDCNGTETDPHRGFYFGNAEDANSILTGFTIINGYAIYPGGGGISCSNSSPTISNCIISGNLAISSGADGGNGGGIFCYGSPTISNCIISANLAINEMYGGEGGGICCYGSPTITNCTISDNTAERGGGICCYGNSSPVITNCILWGNEAPRRGPELYLGGDSNASVSYTDVQGGQADVRVGSDCTLNWGAGNIDLDPLFALATDYHLMPGSPCIDAGTNDPCGGLPPTDKDGVPRPLDGDGDANAVADMGAYEYAPNSPSIAVSALSFYFVQNWPKPDPQMLQIRNCGGRPLHWEVVEDCSWLEVAPANGVSADQINEVTLTVDPNGLAPGLYSCTFNVQDANASNSPVTIRVTMPVGTVLPVPSPNYPTIQAAIDAADNYDIVLVADGNYTGEGNKNLDFRGKAITVCSENGPNNCTIDCENSDRGFYFQNGETENSLVDGFTITNAGTGIYCYRGSNPTINDCIISNNTGGISCDDSNPTINDCIISNNTGRGIWCDNGNPTINDCIISNNTGSGISCPGGGITITNCTITENEFYGFGCGGGNFTITDSTINNNTGGGINNGRGDSRLTITNSTINNNTGRGILCGSRSNLTIINSTITGNSTKGEYDSDGGGILCYRGSPTITNCTITGNTAGEFAGGISFYGGSPIITNCIIWGNEAPKGPQIHLERDSNASVSYTDVEGGEDDVYVEPGSVLNWGPGNIDLDPCFVEPGYWDANDTPDDVNDDFWVDGDYHLLPTSPCIDAGDPNYIPEPNETDLDGNPRVIGDAIDMGAYETNYIEAEMKFTPQMLNCNSKGKYIKAHLTLPEEFLPEDVDVNEPAVAEPIGIESESIKVLGAGTGPVRLEITFDREAFCDELIETGEVEITVIGSLTTSRYFYATDTIKIKP